MDSKPEPAQPQGQTLTARIEARARKVADWLDHWQRASPRNMLIRNAVLLLFFLIYLLFIIYSIYGTS